MLTQSIDPGLSDSEKRLVCGDSHPESADTDRLKFDDAWKELPPAQTEFNLRNFLQERGYFHPLFQLTGGRMLVNAGVPTRVTRLEVSGAPEGLRPERRRKLIGATLTPSVLSATEKWVEQRVRALGYPCPRLGTKGDPETGVIRVEVESGPFQDLREILEHELPGIQGGILRRYDAFQLDQLYNEDLLAVTEARVTTLGLFQNVHFTGSCGPSGAIARQDIVAGPPRLVRLGVGYDTEDGIRLRASWRNTRLGARASWLDVSLLVSNREQLIDLSLDWYFLSYSSRKSLRPAFRISHDNEIHYEIFDERAQASFSTTYDSQVLGLRLLLGPAFERVRTVQGIGPNSSTFVSLESQLQFRSHAYEYFLTNPRSGWNSVLTAAVNSQEFMSTVSAQRFSWNGQVLWNYRELDPPLWVLGARFGLKTVVTGDDRAAIPPNFRQYLGGSTDLRGFGRQELPNEEGALSSAFVSLEARLVATLPASLEPIFFIDFGELGVKPFSLDAPLYLSPGVGLRWGSPIGVIRGTAARGTARGFQDHWQFYLSFGEEF